MNAWQIAIGLVGGVAATFIGLVIALVAVFATAMACVYSDSLEPVWFGVVLVGCAVILFSIGVRLLSGPRVK